MPVIWDDVAEIARWVDPAHVRGRPLAVRDGGGRWVRPGDQVAPPEEPPPIRVREWNPQEHINALRGAQWVVQREDQILRPGVIAGVPLPHFLDSPGLRGESLFKLILSGIKEVFDVDGVIAGGAVRDLVVNAENDSNDVDVFLPMKWEDFNGHQDQLGWEVRAYKVNNDYSKNKKLKTSNRAQARVQGMLVDLVFTDKPLDQKGVDRFPVNAQKCVWTLDGGMRVSPEAQADIDGKMFTISDKITDKEAIKRIRDKVQKWTKREAYRGWKIVEPDIQEWWEKKEMSVA
jgi:hypothetical protein